MAIHKPSCAVAFPRVLENATDTEQATDNATTTEQNASKPASLQGLRAQLRAQLMRNQDTKNTVSDKAELRTELRSCEAEKQAELRALILSCGKYYGFSPADFNEALKIGLADLDSALVCYRSIFKKISTPNLIAGAES